MAMTANEQAVYDHACLIARMVTKNMATATDKVHQSLIKAVVAEAAAKASTFDAITTTAGVSLGL